MDSLVETLRGIVGARYVIERPTELLVYESDGLPGYHKRPRLMVSPANGEECIAVVRALSVRKIGGQTPRNFNIDPSGNFLLAAGQNSHDIRSFRIDLNTGKLTPTDERWEVGSPVCLRFVPLK
mgnify:CR=1 FL=1